VSPVYISEIFLDECQLLFQEVLDHADAEAIVGDVQHQLVMDLPRL
jgi:hypothetical protein